jgi:hypothetical protein
MTTTTAGASFDYKNPNKVLKTLKAKISGRAMIQVASSKTPASNATSGI